MLKDYTQHLLAVQIGMLSAISDIDVEPEVIGVQSAQLAVQSGTVVTASDDNGIGVGLAFSRATNRERVARA